MSDLWLILESQPVDNSCSIGSNARLTCTHLKSTCTDGFYPHSWRRMNTWKMIAMAQGNVHLNLLLQVKTITYLKIYKFLSNPWHKFHLIVKTIHHEWLSLRFLSLSGISFSETMVGYSYYVQLHWRIASKNQIHKKRTASPSPSQSAAFTLGPSFASKTMRLRWAPTFPDPPNV